MVVGEREVSSMQVLLSFSRQEFRNLHPAHSLWDKVEAALSAGVG
jgi:hypothetical protein